MLSLFESNLLEVIVQKQGCKGTEVPVGYLDIFAKDAIAMKLFTTEDMLLALENLVISGDIVEIDYTLASMPERSKSFYLPRGSKVQFELSTEA